MNYKQLAENNRLFREQCDKRAEPYAKEILKVIVAFEKDIGEYVDGIFLDQTITKKTDDHGITYILDFERRIELTVGLL